MLNTWSYTYLHDAQLLPILLVLGALCAVFLFLKKADTKTVQTESAAPKPLLAWVKPALPPIRMTAFEKRQLLLLTLLYAVVGFWKLGSAAFPSTTWQPTCTPQAVVFNLSEETHFDAVYTLYGEGDNNANPAHLQVGVHNIRIEGSMDEVTWSPLFTLNGGSLYQYHIENGDWNYRYVRLTSINPDDTLSEIAFKAFGQERLLPVEIESDAQESSRFPATLLIDEQDKVALDPTYMDESYFDEVYHPRNAWEIRHQQFMYASVHPLLGTSLIALSIRLFGMNPLAWRLPGAIFGALLIPLFYGLARILFRRHHYAQTAAFLLAVSFMHLTTSRIATLEPFSVFWILAMFYFMIRYCQGNMFETDFKKDMRLLCLSGLTMGLGMATKWTVCYSALGLALLLFGTFYVRYTEYRKTVSICRDTMRYDALSDAQKIYARHIQTTFWKTLAKTVAFCFLFFILVPLVIYWLSYLWCPVWRDGWSVSHVLSQNAYMYNYHVNLKATHPYQSVWYQWLLDIRPIWYYGRQAHNGMYNSIACFSNPLLSWAGLFAVPYTAYAGWKKKDAAALTILVGYLTALGPWVFLVNRCVFAYHFYPTAFFMLLGIVYALRDLAAVDRRAVFFIRFYLCACAIVFFLFLPATAGFATPREALAYLQWLPSWYFGG